jgi:hypothetical protein
MGADMTNSARHRPHRECFALVLNSEEADGAAANAKEAANEFLKEACLAQQQLGHASQPLAFFPYSREDLKSWCDSILFSQTPPPDPLHDPDREHYRWLIHQLAPQCLLEGCWLQNIATAATAHEEIHARLFRIYSAILGDGDITLNRHHGFRRWLNRHSIDAPSISSRGFIAEKNTLDAAFCAPLLQLSLSQFPQTFLPEILGVTLAHCLGLSARHIFTPAIQRFDASVPYALLDPSHPETLETVLGIIDTYLQTLPSIHVEPQLRRVWNGVVAQWLADEPLRQQILERLSQPPSTPSVSDQVIAIIEKKRRYARGHHHNIQIGGKALDEWFDDDFDGAAFLQALAASPFIARGSPENSRLLRQSIAFGGPMFKVFTDEEIAVMRAWVESLDHTPANIPVDTPEDSLVKSFDRLRTNGDTFTPHMVRQAHHERSPHLAVRPEPVEGHSHSFFKQKPVRESYKHLFHHLINIERFPDYLPIARRVAARHLQAARSAMRGWHAVPDLRFFEYSPQALDARIHQIYQGAMDSYKPFAPPPRLTREEYRWLLRQVAPIVMVDGCWLQKCAQAGHDDTPIASYLFRIYADEIGNGNPFHNHTNVYRRTLEQAGMPLPEVTSLDFVQQAGIADANFRLPVFMLAISQFPRAFLPEILGLNLAIELSGLGGFYMRLADELRFWKLDPTFVILHNTIDNLASGHAALARDAIVTHLDQIFNEHGQAEMQHHWERVWSGYVSLSVAPRKTWRVLVLKFLWRFGPGRLGRMVKRFPVKKFLPS